MHILTIYGDELYHYGIRGQKWGLRRFQNKDGTWTAKGKARRASVFTVDSAKTLNKAYKYYDANRNAGGSSDAPFIIFDQDYVEQVGSKQIK